MGGPGTFSDKTQLAQSVHYENKFPAKKINSPTGTRNYFLGKKRSRTFLPDFKLQPDALKLLTVRGSVDGNGLDGLDDACGNFVGVG